MFYSLKRHEYLIIVISILLYLAGMWFVLDRVKEDNIRLTETSLKTINETNKEALKQWLNFRRTNIKQLAKNEKLIKKAEELLALPKDSSTLVSSSVTEDLRDFFEPILNANEDLGVFFISPDYTSIFSMRNENTGSQNIMAIRNKDLLDRVLLGGETVLFPPIISDISENSKYRSQTSYTMFLVTPLRLKNQIIAAFSLRLDIHKDFSRILQMGSFGITGNTLVCDLEGSILTVDELPFGSEDRDTAIIQNIRGDLREEMLMHKDSLDKMKEIQDFRNEPVYAVCSIDEDLGMGIITKIDREESLQDYYFIRKILFLILVMVVILEFMVVMIIVGLRQKYQNELLLANKRLAAQVNIRTAELRDSLKVKDSFFTIIAHDLRNPLFNIVKLFEILIKKPKAFPEEKKQELMIQLFNSSNELKKLLANLLDWSRAQTNSITLNFEKIDIRKLVNENIKLHEFSAKEKQLDLINELNEEIFIHADYNTMSTVFRNLISNAIKFSNTGGKISIKAECNLEKVTISVEDNGVGISENELKKLFKLGERVTTRGTNNELGSGLGLKLCKEFVEKNNGHIRAESMEGKGSKFIMEFPISS